MSFHISLKVVKTSVSCTAFLYCVVLEWRVEKYVFGYNLELEACHLKTDAIMDSIIHIS